MLIQGYITQTTEKAVAFVANDKSSVAGVRPLWVPVAKIAAQTERDEMDRKIATDKGDRRGIPTDLDVCDDFLRKVGAA